MMADEHEIAGALTAKRLKYSSTSTYSMVSSKQSRSIPTTSSDLSKLPKDCDELSRTNHKLSKFQPKVVLTRLNKQQINEYLNPSINKKFKNASGKLKAKSMNNMAMDLNVANRIDIETVKTHRIGANSSSQVENSRQRDPNLIDYKLWQWQPQLRLSNLSNGDLRGVKRYQPDENENSEVSWLMVNPIEFDKDQSLIEELSPQAATQQFQKVNPLNVHSLNLKCAEFFFLKFQRLSAIKNSSSFVSVHTNTVAGETRSKKRYLEYEKTHKELQSKKRPMGRGGFRKLFSPDYSPDNDDLKVNMVLTQEKDGEKKPLDIDMVQTRSSKRLRDKQSTAP